MIDSKQCILVLVDAQIKLIEHMSGKDRLVGNLARAVKGALMLDIPVIWTEQAPDKMGRTVPELETLLTRQQPIHKKSFSCCGEPRFMTELEDSGRDHVFLCGIETHVCIYLSAVDLKAGGYKPEIIADCVSSRKAIDRDIALDRLRSQHILSTCVETFLFEAMGTADHPRFRELIKIIK